jgi:outer membrane immunogenic protein
MRRRTFLRFSLIAGLIGIMPIVAAWAAELPVKAPPPAPLPAWTWTGFYFGANVGVGVGRTRFYDIYGPDPDYALDADSHLAGGLGGFQLGYNYQLNWLVVGLQGGFDWGGIKRTFPCYTFGNQSCSADAEWIGSLTGLAGVAIGRSLLYADGGPAWMRNTISNIAGSQACVPTGGTTVCSAPGDLFLGSGIVPGWTVGGGFAYKISPNWSAFVQYNYMDFGTHPVTLVDGGTGIFPEDIKEQLQLITFGFNYTLTGPTNGPVWPLASPFTGEDDDTGRNIRVFSSLDVAKDSMDGEIGALYAFSKDLDTSGPRLWISGGAGWYQFPTDSGKVRGVYSTGDLMGGYGFEGDNYEINLLAGGSAENDILSAYDATDPVNGTAFGPKVRGDIYVNPTDKSVFYGEAEYTTAFQTYWTAATYGYDVFGKGFYVGPEVVAFGDARFDQWRVGLRLIDLKIGRVEVDLSSGFAHDDVVGNGAYGHLEVETSF